MRAKPNFCKKCQVIKRQSYINDNDNCAACGTKLKFTTKILHVEQPSTSTCCHSVIAMISGKHVADVVNAFGEDSMSNEDVDACLHAIGYKEKLVTVGDMSLFAREGLYFLTVASHHYGWTHAILMSGKWNGYEWVYKIYDPLESKVERIDPADHFKNNVLIKAYYLEAIDKLSMKKAKGVFHNG